MNDDKTQTGDTTRARPRPDHGTFAFDRSSVRRARTWSVHRGRQLGLAGASLQALESITAELVANAVLHAGGRGRLRVWRDHLGVVCEVHDHGPGFGGRIRRTRPDPLQIGGRGLYLVRRLSDSVTHGQDTDGFYVRARVGRTPTELRRGGVP